MEGENYFTLKEVKLNNNCPECYSSDGLQLTFKQRFVETPFYKAITEDTKHEMHCNTCQTDIYPIRWTHDIEQVVAYQERAVDPKSSSFKLTKLSFGLIAVIAIVGIGGALVVSGIVTL